MSPRLEAVSAWMDLEYSSSMQPYYRSLWRLKIFAFLFPIIGLAATLYGFLFLLDALQGMYSGGYYEIMERMYISSIVSLFFAAGTLVGHFFLKLGVDNLSRECKQSQNILLGELSRLELGVCNA